MLEENETGSTMSMLLGYSDITWLKKQVDGERTDLAALEERSLRAGITLWEMEQMMRQDWMNILPRVDPYEVIDDFGDDRDGWGILQYSKHAHASLNPLTGKFTICPFNDVLKMWNAAQQWAEERIKEHDFQFASCDAGRRRRFISERLNGLESAIAQLGWTIRFEKRHQCPEIMTRNGKFILINDRLEAAMREIISSVFCFAKPGKARPKARPAKWNNTEWNNLFNAYLSDREVDSFEQWLRVRPHWDGQPRLDFWLEHASFTPGHGTSLKLVQWVARSILLVAVMRALKPGAKHDICPVIVGPQGCGKSTALQWLLPEEYRPSWFTDTLKLSDTDKQRVEALQGAVIAEVSEMTGATTSDIESMKAFLSRTNDKIRLAYRRNPEATLRTASIAGTANGSAILPNDPSGNRRFVAINMQFGNAYAVRKYLDENRDMLWAEAFHRITQMKEDPNLPEELEYEQRKVNESFRFSDTLIEDSVMNLMVTKFEAGHESVTINNVVTELKLTGDNAPETLPRREQLRITRIFDKLGLKRERIMKNGTRATYFKFPDNFAEVIARLENPVFTKND